MNIRSKFLRATSAVLVLTSIALGPLLLTMPSAKADLSGLSVEVYDVLGQNEAPYIPQGASPILTTNVPNIDFQWGSGEVAGTTNTDDVIVLYKGWITSDTTQDISFLATADDGTMLYIDGNLVTSDWVDKGGGGTTSAPVSFTAGVSRSIVLMYYENGGGAWVQLSWDKSGSMEIIPASAFQYVATPPPPPPIIDVTPPPLPSNIIDQCVANIADPAFTKSAILSIVGKTEQELLDAVASGSLTVVIAQKSGEFGNGNGNAPDIYCGNSQDNAVTDLDSNAGTKDYFFGGAGNDWVFHAWYSVFYGGEGDDSIVWLDEASYFDGGAGTNACTNVIGGSTCLNVPPPPEVLSVGAPSNLTVVDGESSTVLTWNAPTDGTRQPERYAISFTCDGCGGWGIATGNVGDANALNTTITIDHSVFDSLKPSGTTWTFTIRSDNDTLALYSSLSNAVTVKVGMTAEELAAIQAAIIAEQNRLAELARIEAARLEAEAAALLAAQAAAAQAEADRLAALAAAKAAADKAAADKLAAEQAAAEAAAAKAEADRLAAEQAAAQAEADRIAAEKAAAEAQAAADQAAADAAAAEAAAAQAAAEAAAQAEADAKAQAEAAAAEAAAQAQAEADAKAEAEAAAAEAEAQAQAEADALAAEEAAQAEAEAQAQAEADALAAAEAKEQAAIDAAAEEKAAEAEAKDPEKQTETALADGKVSNEEAEKVGDALAADGKVTSNEISDVVDAIAGKDGELSKSEIAAVANVLVAAFTNNGDAIPASAMEAAGIEYKDLPAETPVEVRTDSNGNEVVITAETAANIELITDPGALAEALFSDPGAALQAFGSLGADMSDEERAQSKEAVVATVVAAGAAIQAAAGAATSAAGGASSSGGSGGGGGGGGASGDGKGKKIARRRSTNRTPRK